MRIVLLITDLLAGGAPLRIARLGTALARLGVDVHVGCLGAEGAAAGRLRTAGVPTFSCHARHAADLTALLRLRGHIRRIAPDIVHATLTHANVAARLACVGLRLIVLTSTATIEVERRWHGWIERLTAWMDAGHVVNSRALARHVERAFGIAPHRVHIVPPAVDLPPAWPTRAESRRLLGIGPEVRVIAWAGRLDPVKRVERLVESLMHLADLEPLLLIAGDGPELDYLREVAGELSVAERVRWLGWVEDLASLLPAADVYACVSRTEGMPNAVLEALAAGVPVIGPDIPALRELSDGGRRLHLLDSDTPACIAAGVRRVLAGGDWVDEMVAEAARWARSSLDPMEAARQLLAVYERRMKPPDAT